MLLDALHADSVWGPALGAAGASSLLAAVLVHGVWRWPTILPPRDGAAPQPPTLAERVSVHLVIYGGWAVGFGVIIWRGVPANALDVRFAFERGWPVWEMAEWIYLSVYFVPALMPWLAPSRAALRRYALNLWWLLLFSLPLFLLPLASPPRSFTPDSLAGKILAWETGRADFAAASLPSFHVFWGLLVAQLLASRGRAWAWAGSLWAMAVMGACVATGTHALADVAVSLLLFPLVAAAESPVARSLQAAADRFLRRSPIPSPVAAPSTIPPRP